MECWGLAQGAGGWLSSAYLPSAAIQRPPYLRQRLLLPPPRLPHHDKRPSTAEMGSPPKWDGREGLRSIRRPLEWWVWSSTAEADRGWRLDWWRGWGRGPMMRKVLGMRGVPHSWAASTSASVLLGSCPVLSCLRFHEGFLTRRQAGRAMGIRYCR